MKLGSKWSCLCNIERIHLPTIRPTVSETVTSTLLGFLISVSFKSIRECEQPFTGMIGLSSYKLESQKANISKVYHSAQSSPGQEIYPLSLQCFLTVVETV